MQTSLFLRATARPAAKLPSLSASVPRNVRSMGSAAMFKVPRIDNDPNVRSFQPFDATIHANALAETLRSWIPRSQGFGRCSRQDQELSSLERPFGYRWEGGMF